MDRLAEVSPSAVGLQVDLWYTTRWTSGTPRTQATMKSREKSTRERLIDAAVRRFYRDGFRNVGIEQAYSDVGISKTAFYKHFESKDDLMLAVLAEQTRWMRESLRGMIRLRGGSSTIGQLRCSYSIWSSRSSNATISTAAFSSM